MPRLTHTVADLSAKMFDYRVSEKDWLQNISLTLNMSNTRVLLQPCYNPSRGLAHDRAYKDIVTSSSRETTPSGSPLICERY